MLALGLLPRHLFKAKPPNRLREKPGTASVANGLANGRAYLRGVTESQPCSLNVLDLRPGLCTLHTQIRFLPLFRHDSDRLYSQLRINRRFRLWMRHQPTASPSSAINADSQSLSTRLTLPMTTTSCPALDRDAGTNSGLMPRSKRR